MKSGKAVDGFAALAHPHRLAIVRLLARTGEGGLHVGAIAESLGVPNSSISFHLTQLRRAGLIRQQRRSRLLIYSTNESRVHGLAAYLADHCRGSRKRTA